MLLETRGVRLRYLSSFGEVDEVGWFLGQEVRIALFKLEDVGQVHACVVEVVWWCGGGVMMVVWWWRCDGGGVVEVVWWWLWCGVVVVVVWCGGGRLWQ